MFDKLLPRLSTIAPNGGAIYLRRQPDGIAYKIRSGVDFDNPTAVRPADASVAVLIDILRQMNVPGVPDRGIPTSVFQLAPEQGVGLLIKRNPIDGSFVFKVESPCDFDAPDKVAPMHASLYDLLSWVKAVTTPQ